MLGNQKEKLSLWPSQHSFELEYNRKRIRCTIKLKLQSDIDTEKLMQS